MAALDIEPGRERTGGTKRSSGAPRPACVPKPQSRIQKGGDNGEPVNPRPAVLRPYRIPAGSPTHYCRGCRERIYWVQAGSVRRLKINPDGSKHRCKGARDARA